MSRRRSSGELRPASDLVGAALTELGVQKAARQAMARAAWDRVVPDALLAQTEAWRLDKHTLWVRCGSGALAHQLRLHEPQLLEGLRAATAALAGIEIKALRFSSDQVVPRQRPAPPAPALAGEEEPADSPEEVARLASIAAPVADDDLRATLLRILVSASRHGPPGGEAGSGSGLLSG